MIRKDDLYYLIQKKKPHSNHQGSPRLRAVGNRGSQGGKRPPSPRIFTELDAKLSAILLLIAPSDFQTFLQPSRLAWPTPWPWPLASQCTV